jgi:3-oxoacyl-[acyl-carrier-protein] synthase-3
MTQDRIGLIGLGAYVPERIMTNDEWTQYVDTSDDWITTRTGIKRRHLAADDQNTADLAVFAAQSALADAGLTADRIDEIILASDTPEVYTPDTASFVQHKLGAGEIPAYDLGGSGCAGFVLGLDIARSRVGNGDRRILVIGVELLTRLMSWRDRNTCVLFGDAAGAAIVGRGDRAAEIVAATAGTDGSRGDILTAEIGGTRAPFNAERARQLLDQWIVMKGREVFREATTRMCAAANEVLRQAGYDVDDVALVIPHQANLRIIQATGKTLGVPEEKVYANVREYGNTGSASVPLALWEARETGRIAAGDLVLLTSFGAGFHWAAMLLRF